MAAGAWNIFPYAKLKFGQGTLDLSAGNTILLALHSVGASANLLGTAVSTWGSIGSQVAGTNYTAGGETLSGNTWLLSGNNAVFDSDNWTVTGSISSIKYAVIYQRVGASTGFPLCFSTLTTAANFITLGVGNTLTIQMAPAGIFTLS
jgi:hypothetical protein